MALEASRRPSACPRPAGACSYGTPGSSSESRYFLDEGTTTYTHVADQHSTYGTKVISSTVREATYVLDEILGNPTDLPIAEHAVDTHGQTFAAFAAFAAFDLLGLHLSPRIRDLASLQLYRLGPAAEQAAYPHAGPLLTRRLQTELIESQWDQLLRLAGSLKFGHASASLLIAKLQAGERQNTLTRALIEYGRLVRTTFVLRYLADEALQRRVHQQLNKGESLHALRRRLFFSHQGHVRRHHHGEQTDQALCLTLVTNAVVLFNTVYLPTESARRPAPGRARRRRPSRRAPLTRPAPTHQLLRQLQLRRRTRTQPHRPPTTPRPAGLTTKIAPLLREPPNSSLRLMSRWGQGGMAGTTASADLPTESCSTTTRLLPLLVLPNRWASVGALRGRTDRRVGVRAVTAAVLEGVSARGPSCRGRRRGRPRARP